MGSLLERNGMAMISRGWMNRFPKIGSGHSDLARLQIALPKSCRYNCATARDTCGILAERTFLIEKRSSWWNSAKHDLLLGTGHTLRLCYH
jgi:hypothetical protein